MKISAYYDRDEGNLAVLLLGDDMKKVNFPRAYLPSDVHEGDYLLLDISYDKETTEQAEREAMAIRDE